MPTPREGSDRRLLIVACDYDADASPQGLRWVALSRELAALGWDVDVLTWRTPCQTPATASVRVHAVPGGPYARLLERLRRRRSVRASMDATHAAVAPGTGATVRASSLNWKGRLERRLQALASHVMYPDLRREGVPSLRAALDELVRRHPYAAVVLSHEPPFALELLDDVVARKIPVVADLGDPVCAIYTAPRWRRRALALEARVWRVADAVVVTAASTLRLLERRHGPHRGESAVITQGFTPGAGRDSVPPRSEGERLTLVYTGRFYRFRDPGPVLDAVMDAEGVALELAVPELPEKWLEGPWRSAAHIRMHGRLSHEDAVRLQHSADVLLVIGNDDPAQTPGKLYEYFGMRRPILYVARHPADPAADLVNRLRRGRVVAPERDAIAAVLAELAGLHREGRLASQFDLSDAAVSEYAWPQLARRYSDLLARVRPVDA